MDLSGMQLAPQGAKAEDLDALALPKDLRTFLEQHNGGLGMLGNRPLDLWSAAQIAKEAQSQDVSLAIPGLLLFGTDGGAEGYGHLARLSKNNYGRISLLAAGVHEFEGIANTFDDFLKALSDGR